MKQWILGIALFWSVFSGPLMAEVKHVMAVSEEWEDGTNADGSGFYWDLLKLVYEPMGISVETATMPYARAVKMVELNKADLWVGSYASEEDFALYPRSAFDADIVTGIYQKGSLDATQGQKSLEGKKVGWIRGYDYDQYLDVKVTYEEVKNRKSAILMIQKGRLDVLLDAKTEIENTIKNENIDMADLESTKLLELKLYMAYSSGDKGKKLANIWDDRMKALHENGELKTFYQKHEYTDYYPF